MRIQYQPLAGTEALNESGRASKPSAGTVKPDEARLTAAAPLLSGAPPDRIDALRASLPHYSVPPAVLSHDLVEFYLAA